MMRSLLLIEFRKLWASRYFRVLGILWGIAFLSIPFGVVSLLNSIDVSELDSIIPIQPKDFPIFDFADIWQNLAWVYKFQTILLSFMVVISVTNEFDYKTVRQNIIDGMSRTSFWMSKLALVLMLSTAATVLLMLEGFLAGLAWSPTRELGVVFQHFEFVGAYWLHVTSFLMFAYLISLWIKRAGFVIFFILIWNYILEGIAWLYNWGQYMSGHVETMLYTAWLPLEGSSNLIPRPVEKYVLQPVQDYVGVQDLLFALFWLGIYLWLTHRTIARRDL